MGAFIVIPFAVKRDKSTMDRQQARADAPNANSSVRSDDDFP
jgi:hypothetical protein